MDRDISRLVDIVGRGSIDDHPEQEEFRSLEHRFHTYFPASLRITPRNVDEVKKVVEWANETRIPLVPVSSGGPHFYGDTDPSVQGAMIVDLSGMNRILKVDRRNRLALIEPGVTYHQLIPELRREGMRIAMPLLPRVNKSVVTSLLERQPLTSPKYQWNFLDPLRSLEIVWGSGDKFFSGSGTFRGEQEEDWKHGLVPVQGPGPGQLDFYKFVSAAQGSMGIITWASVKCEVFSDVHKLFFIPGESLDELVDFIYKVTRVRFGDELFILNRACLASMLASQPDDITARKSSLPPWIAVVGISGGQILANEKVETQEKDIRDLAQQTGLRLVTEIDGCHACECLEMLHQPSTEPYWKLRYKGASQEIFFLTTLDKTPEFLNAMVSAADEHKYPDTDIGVYIQPVHQGVGCHCEFLLPYDRDNPSDTDQTAELFRDASLRLFNKKAYFSRPYGIWADMVYSADPTTAQITRKMKDIFDPRHVMNPGKLCF